MYATNSDQYIEYAKNFGVDKDTVMEVMAEHNYCNNAECDLCVDEIKARIRAANTTHATGTHTDIPTPTHNDNRAHADKPRNPKGGKQ